MKIRIGSGWGLSPERWQWLGYSCVRPRCSICQSRVRSWSGGLRETRANDCAQCAQNRFGDVARSPPVDPSNRTCATRAPRRRRSRTGIHSIRTPVTASFVRCSDQSLVPHSCVVAGGLLLPRRDTPAPVQGIGARFRNVMWRLAQGLGLTRMESVYRSRWRLPTMHLAVSSWNREETVWTMGIRGDDGKGN